jgi:hypothetical protein
LDDLFSNDTVRLRSVARFDDGSSHASRSDPAAPATELDLAFARGDRFDPDRGLPG